MKRQLFRWAAIVQIGLVLFTGCHPTQPFFVAEDGDLSHYLRTATDIEYPDLQSQPLAEATESLAPFTIDNTNFEFLDLTLEECINYALVNAKLITSVPGSSQFDGDIISTILSSQSQQLRTIYDPALVSSTTNSQPLVVDQNGNRILPRGAVRGNQVGGVEDALSEFDAQYQSILSYNTTDRQRNTNFLNSPPFFTGQDTTYQNSLSKRIATGGVVTARSQTIYSANNVNTTGGARIVPSDYTQVLEAQIQHPLMRNRGTLVNRIPVVLARLNEDQSLNQFEESVRNLVKKVEFAYWDLYCTYWAYESAKLGWQSSLKVYSASEARKDVGVGENAPAYQAKAQVHRFHAQLKAALGGATTPGADPGVLGRESELRYLMGWGATDGRLIRPSDRPTVARTSFDWADVRAETLGRNLEIRNQKTNIKRAELELISSKNQLLPDLNLSALYRWTGMGDSWLTQNGGDEFPGTADSVKRTSAMESLFGGRFQEAGLRLEFTPNAIGMRRSLADVTNKELALAREHAVLEQREITAVYALSREIRNLDGNYEQLNLKLHEWTESEMESNLRMAKYEGGAPGTEGLLEELLRAQQRRAQSQQEYYRAVCEYNKSIVMVHLMKGTLLDYNNVALTEGPWSDKANWDAHERARERDAALFLPYGGSRPSVVSQGPVPQRALGDQVGNFDNSMTELPAAQEMMMDQSFELPQPEKLEQVKPEMVPTPLPGTSSLLRSKLQDAKVPNAMASQASTFESPIPSPATDKGVQPAQWTPRSARGSVGTGAAGQSNPLRNQVEWSKAGNTSTPVNSLRNQ